MPRSRNAARSHTVERVDSSGGWRREAVADSQYCDAPLQFVHGGTLLRAVENGVRF